MATDETDSRLEALKRARDTGVLIVRHGETFTQYRSLDEIDRIISTLEGETASSGSRRRVRYLYQSGKGL